MANNKVQLANGTVLMDVTNVTVESQYLSFGKSALQKNGELIFGSNSNIGDIVSVGIIIDQNTIYPLPLDKIIVDENISIIQTLSLADGKAF